MSDNYTARIDPALWLAVSTALALMAAMAMGFKWVALLLLAVGALAGLTFLATGRWSIERSFLYAFVLAGSIRLDVYIVHVSGAEGFGVNLQDVCWFMLMGSWVFRVVFRHDSWSIPKPYGALFLVMYPFVIVAGVRSVSAPLGLRMIVAVLQAFLLFAYLWNFKFSREVLVRIAWWSCAALLLQSVIGVLQALTQSTLGLEYFGASDASYRTIQKGIVSISRVGGTIGQPNRFALFVNGLIFLPMVLTLFSSRVRARLSAAAILGMGVIVLILTKSRGGWLGFGLMSVAFVWYLLRERLQATRASIVVLWLLLLAVASAVSIPPVSERLFTDDMGSAFKRVPMAQVAVAMIVDNPIFGVGFYNYVDRAPEYDKTAEGVSYTFQYPVHTVPLYMAAEFGLAVLCTYLLLLALFIRESCFLLLLRAPEIERYIGIAMAVGLGANFVHWPVILSVPLTDLRIWFSLGLVIGVARWYRGGRNASLQPQRPQETVIGRFMSR